MEPVGKGAFLCWYLYGETFDIFIVTSLEYSSRIQNSGMKKDRMVLDEPFAKIQSGIGTACWVSSAVVDHDLYTTS